MSVKSIVGMFEQQLNAHYEALDAKQKGHITRVVKHRAEALMAKFGNKIEESSAWHQARAEHMAQLLAKDGSLNVQSANDMKKRTNEDSVTRMIATRATLQTANKDTWKAPLPKLRPPKSLKRNRDQAELDDKPDLYFLDTFDNTVHRPLRLQFAQASSHAAHEFVPTDADIQNLKLATHVVPNKLGTDIFKHFPANTPHDLPPLEMANLVALTLSRLAKEYEALRQRWHEAAMGVQRVERAKGREHNAFKDRVKRAS